MTTPFSTEDLHYAEQPVYSKNQNTNLLSTREEKQDDFASDNPNTNKKRMWVSTKNLILLMKLLILQFMFTMIVAQQPEPPINYGPFAVQDDLGYKFLFVLMIQLWVVAFCISKLIPNCFSFADKIAFSFALIHFLFLWHLIYQEKDNFHSLLYVELVSQHRLMYACIIHFIIFILNLVALVCVCSNYKQECIVYFTTDMLIINTIIHFFLSIAFFYGLRFFLWSKLSNVVMARF